MSNAQRKIGFAFIGLLLVLAGTTPALSYSSQEFVDQLKAKFRTTSNIYLKAHMHRAPSGTGSINKKADTAAIVAAYQYPRQYVQHIAGTNNKHQYIMLKGDSLAVGYPQFDYIRKQSLKKKQARRLLAENIPIAGAFLGISSGRIPADAIRTKSSYDTVQISVNPFRHDLPFTRFQATFTRDNLELKTATITGNEKVRMNVVDYAEEERFPEWIENALTEFRLPNK